MSEPMTGARMWHPVMRAASFRCQCTGQCGNAHKKAQGRCPREHDQAASKHRGPIHLSAAPTDPLTPVVQACRLPASALMAWCPDCHTAARRRANAAARMASQPDQIELF
ncbi:hypothetical protein AB5J55_23540 [Streptomyces sp. R11]|uniref:HNH endonuclease n=1 Tax=Streptomyces sp. R11 TaxID=3238625 RepID=A0AB39N585_9ACTN